MATASVFALVIGALSAISAPAHAAVSGPPFTECPAVGYDSSCGILIELTDSGATVLSDPSQGPYDGIEDTLVGVINDSSAAVDLLALHSGTDIFGFDGDGICTYNSAYCFGPTGYEGPDTAFPLVTPDNTAGEVAFTQPLAPGATTYFALEESLAASDVQYGSGQSTIGVHEAGMGPNQWEFTTTCAAGEPVNCASGDLFETVDDLTVPGRGLALAESRTYNSLLASTDGPFGHGWSSSYGMHLTTDSSGNVTVVEGDGAEVPFTATQAWWGTFYTAPSRVFASLARNSDGTYALTDSHAQAVYRFDTAGLLTSESDRNGETTTLTYASGQLSSVTDPAGRNLTFTVGSDGHVASVTDPAGRTVSFSYDAAGNLVKSTDPAGGVTTYAYDASHLLTSITDPRGSTEKNTYDSSGRVTSQTDRAGRTTTWTYTGDPASTSGATTVVTDPRGVSTSESYSDFALTSVTKAAGTTAAATWTYTFDPFVRGVTSVTDPAGNVTRYAYDGSGNVTSRTDGLGRATTLQYNASNEPTAITDAAGQTTRYGYDSRGNLASLTRPSTGAGTPVISLAHADSAHPGDITSVTDADGKQWVFTYDADGDPHTSTNPLGDTTSYSYDAIGRRLTTTSPRGNASGSDPNAFTTTYTYDALGDVTRVLDALGNASSATYDADRNKVSTTDARGNVTHYTYDADSELTGVTRADGSDLAYAYDADGNQTAQTDAAGHTTAFGYDALDRLISVTDALGRVTAYTYDAAGNRASTTDARGIATTYGHDAANELTSISYSDGTPAVAFTYTATGQRATMTDGTGATSYTYDADGRLTDTTDGAGAHVGYTYDLAGHLTTLTYPNGQSVARTYDAAGQLASVTDWLGHTTSIARNADGAAATTSYANGVTSATAYDNDDRVSSITDSGPSGAIASFSYTRTAGEQLASSTTTGLGEAAQTYGYDTLNQLTGVNAASYGYDPSGAVTALIDGTTQRYDAAGELTSTTAAAGASTAYSYDAAGDRTGAGTTGVGTTGTGPGSCGICVLGGGAAALSAVGSTSVTSSGVITVNSADPAAINADGRAGIGGSKIFTAGGFTLNGSKATVTPTPATGSTTDPFGTVVAPSLTGTPIAVTVDDGADHSVAPGIYSTINVSDGTLTLTPGTYVVTGGISVSGSGRLSGSGVTAYLACSGYPTPCPTGTAGAGVDVAGHGDLTLTKAAVTTGLVVYADPASTAGITIEGAASMSATGSIDLPAGPFAVHGQATAALAGRLVAGEVIADGTAALTETAPAAVGNGETYAYDAEHRLTTLTTTTSTTGFAYDGDGLRASVTTPAKTTLFTWQVASTTVPLLLTDGTTSYVYDDQDNPIEQVAGDGTVDYFLHDQVGSTKALTDQSGAVVATFTYDPYGRLTAHSGSADTALRFTGQYQDASGLYYLRNRYYDPATAAFLTVDPLAPITQQRYSYAFDSPLNFTDPSGLCSWYDVVCDVGAAASWVDDHASDISAATGAAAVILAPIPGLDAASVVLGGISVATGALATGNDIENGEWSQAVLDGFGTALGGAGLAEDLAAKVLMNGARDAWDAADLGAASALAHGSEAAAGYGSALDKTAAALAILGDFTDRTHYFGEPGDNDVNC